MKHILANKILMIFILTVTMFISLSTSATYATTMDGIISGADSFISSGSDDSLIDEGALSTTSDTIYNVLFTIAVVLAFAVGMIIGIQFITASVDEKAKIKETLVPYVIGVFIIFSAFTIWKIAINIGNSIDSGTTTTEPGTGETTVDDDGFSGGTGGFSGGTTVDDDGFSGGVGSF